MKLSRALPERTVRTTAAVLAVAAGVVVLVLAYLVLHNIHGPLPDHPGWAQVLAWTTAVLVGLAAYAGARALLARWWLVVPVVVLALVATGWVLGPRQIEETPSFVPGSGPTHTCSGWVLRYYEPGMVDGSGAVYCFGIETPV